ncbi:glutamate-5-semialdehyde dehydrogenase [Enemella sp. A6]|uniref:glutamate-5-semialdehyde dehydrogenase n=1 Tax=Enemella sp. A6 TaxID=3440152 RepID=UPI003EBB671C
MSFTEQATAARTAAIRLATATRAEKDAALHAMADALLAAEDEILAANQVDITRAEESGTAASLIDRLRLNHDRLVGMADGLRQLADLTDPVGSAVRSWTTPHGLEISQIRVPIGVIGIIYEARPNVTADAAGICLKSGNASLLRGSSSAYDSNVAIVNALRAGLAAADFPEDAVALVAGGREVTTEMMTARGLVDLLIPRGGAGLINAVVTGSQVPVIETGTGNCHLYVHSEADQQMALDIMVNAKLQRPSVCNALETLLVDEAIAEDFLAKALPELTSAGVTVHGDGAVVAAGNGNEHVVPAAEGDFDEEWLSLDLSAKVVADMDEAIEHIRAHTSGHSESIVTDNAEAAGRFVDQVDAAAVLVNASSRFVDGGEFGFGAEIGISTQKTHARGPMALPEMTSTKFVVRGTGQVRG